jgi:23S rRNA (cytidine1920-2'-O)/16S rRNA (cytidine1409-2'-O)-methyltransferase
MRLDRYLSEREQIDLPVIVSLIMTGKVLVDGRPETKPGRQISERNSIVLKERPRQYPARSASKLLGAMESFRALSVESIESRIAEHICVDLGASHGGFTRVLLDRGARRVYAVDVARGLLHHSLQRNERVIVLDRHNVRFIDASWFDAADLALQPWFFTCDISFLSLATVLEAVAGFAARNSLSFSGIFLLKPQFEASKHTEKGILRDEELRLKICKEMMDRAVTLGYTVHGAADSVLAGRRGNVEICLFLEYDFRDRK